MTDFTYNTGIPNGPNNPSADQPKMLVNTTSINGIIAVDHVGFNGMENQGGYHTNIHQPVQGSFPADIEAKIANMTQLYSLLYTPNTSPASVAGSQLYLTNSGGTIQLSGTAQTTDGWAWMGGVLVQWGNVSFAAGNDHLTNSVTFQSRNPGITIPFSNIFTVTATLKNSDTTDTTASNTIAISSISATGFTWVYNSSSSSGSTKYPGFYWIAIGN